MIFPLDPKQLTFSLDNDYGMNDLAKARWTDLKNPTKEFNTQLIQNMLQFNLLTSLCEDKEDIEVPLLADFSEVLNLQTSNTAESCRKFLKIRLSFMDTFSRDQDFIDIAKHSYDMTIYAMVVIDKTSGMYMGHVYLWQVDKNLFMLGIRSTLLMSFLRDKGMGLRNISNIMIDALNLFKDEVGAERTIIPHPIGVMRDILSKAGYKQHKDWIRKEQLGDLRKLSHQLVDYNGYCDDCFVKY